MKKLYTILIIGLLSILAYSCTKSKANEFKPDLPPAVVTGYQTTYTVYTHKDTLSIAPTVPDERLYDFYWTVFSNNYTVGSGVVPRGDTLSRSKNLKYEVLLNPGKYTLVFNVKNRNTGVTQMITSDLSVSTLTMSGWYMLKDDGAKTDFDFIYPAGRINNWIANFNGGKSLNGKSIKAVFSSSFKKGLTSTDLFSVFTVVSDQDAAIYRIDNGKLVMGFDDMFFTKPATRKPQNVIQPVADNFINLINDGKVYTMVKGSLFADPPASNYKMSPVAAVGSLVLTFDDVSKSMVFLDGANFSVLGSNGNDLKNMNASVVWIGGYPGLRNAATILFRKNTGEGSLVKLNAAYGFMAGYSSPLITGTKTVPQAHGLMSADVIGGNYDSDYIYYSKGNNIYMTDFASLQENLQVSLPVGETVTSIQHIKYPHPAAAGAVVTTDYLAIASYVNGNYKVWLHKISSTGTIQALPKPNFEGQGRVSCVNYLEQGTGNRTY